MILIITMSDDQVSKHKMVIAWYCNAMQAGKLSELRETGQTTLIDLIQLLLNQEESFIHNHKFIYLFIYLYFFVYVCFVFFFGSSK